MPPHRPVSRRAENLVDRHAGLFSDNIPTSIFDHPRTRCDTGNIAELGHDLFYVTGIVTDHEHLCVLHRIADDRQDPVGGFHARITSDSLVCMNTNHKNDLSLFCFSRVPCWVERLRIWNLNAIIGDICDFQANAPLSCILHKKNIIFFSCTIIIPVCFSVVKQ